VLPGILTPRRAREAQMGKYVKQITYKGKEILFMNAAGVNEEEGISAWEEMKQEALKRQGIRLTLVDGTNIAITPALVRKAREVAEMGEGKNAANRVAFVGLTTIQKSTANLIAKAVHLQAHFCNTLEEGKEWLVKEDAKGRKG
jgi:hypothetical protein